MNPKPATIQASQITLKAVFPKDKDLALPLLQNKEIAKTYMMPDFKDEEAVIKLFEAFGSNRHNVCHFSVSPFDLLKLFTLLFL